MAFSFGKPAANTGGGGLFGSSQQTSTAPGQPQQAQTGLFGGGQSLFGAPSTSQPSATPSLFGQPAQSTNQPSTSLFGSSTQANTAQKPSLFGSTSAAPTTSLFGQSQSAASNSLFGPKPVSSLTATTTTNMAASQQPIPKLGEGPLPNPNEPSIESRIEAIKDSWDPQSPKCRFVTFFYNAPVPPMTVQSYGKPVNVDDRQWSKAQRENPDPDKLVPAIATGFGALERRIEAQDKMSAQHEALLEEVHAHLEKLSSVHSLETSLRIMKARTNATALRARLVELVARSSRLSPARNTSIRKEEDDLRVSLERLAKQGELVKGQTNELWARIGSLKAAAARKSADDTQSERDGWTVVDEQSFRQVLEILSKQQNGLDHLTKLLNDAHLDVQTMQEAFGLVVNPRSSKQ